MEKNQKKVNQTRGSDKVVSSREKKSEKITKVISSIIAVIVIIALLGVSLNFFGVPQKTLRAVTIDGKSYAMNELEVYYMMAYNQTVQTASYYDENYGDGYGSMLTGYDSKLSPAAQVKKDSATATTAEAASGESTSEAENTPQTWDEYFLETAISNMADTKRYYNLAMDEKLELTEDQQKDVDDAIDQIKTSRETYASSYSVSRYLSLIYGKGVSLNTFKKVLTEQAYASAYQQKKQDEISDGYSADTIEAEYAKDKTAYDVVSFRWFTIDVDKNETTSSESTTGAEETSSTASAGVQTAEATAEKIISEIKAVNNFNEDTFKEVILKYVTSDNENYDSYMNNTDAVTLLQKISKDSIKTNVNADAADWLYEQDDNGNYVRQSGDMEYYLSSDNATVYIIYAIGTPFRDETKYVSVRHILVKYPEEVASEAVEDSSSVAAAETTTAASTTAESTTVVGETTTISPAIEAECSSEADSILDMYNSYVKEENSGEANEAYFGELASELSDDTGSAKEGGLIEDMQNNGSYVAEFEDWAFSEGNFKDAERKPGTTEVIKTEYGYHVMYFVKRHDNASWYETILSKLSSDAWTEEQKKIDESYGEDAISKKKLIDNWVRKICVKIIDKNLG